MSKVTYLWGAGASRGLRSKPENRGDKGFIIRGVPVISEFKEATADVIKRIEERMLKTNQADAKYIELKTLKSMMTALRSICIDYPTVDTYARLLAVAGIRLDYSPIQDYNDLKKALSLFLTMIQLQAKRDPRYDGFIASVISDKGEMPPMTILSWNYDVQLEQAFAGYSRDYERSKDLFLQWMDMNVYNKTYRIPYDIESPFSVVKLNGTATFSTRGQMIYPGTMMEQIVDGLLRERADSVDYAVKIMDGNYTNHLSYVWEKENQEELMGLVRQRVKDTEELIVIGYSFPYVNRSVDEEILRSMPQLKKVWIQDPNFDDIEDRVKSMLPEELLTEVKIEHVKNMSQFKLPSSF